MTAEIAIVYALIGLALALFMYERVRVDATAVLVNLDVEIIEVLHNGEPLSGASGQLRLREGDVLRVRAGAREINQLLALEGVALMRPGGDRSDRDIETERDALVEAVIGPDSQLGGQTVEEVNFPGRFGAQVLALRQHGELQQKDLREAVLGGGNSVLMKIGRVGDRPDRGGRGHRLPRPGGDRVPHRGGGL